MPVQVPRRQQARPAPWRAHSLWRGCLFAIAGGWFKAKAAGDRYAVFDDVTRGRGTYNVTGADSHVHDVGWMLDSSAVATLSFPAPAGRYDIAHGMSVAVCCYQRTADAAVNTRLVKKRLDNNSAGWDLHIDQVTGRYRFEVGDGATEATAGLYARTLNQRDVIVGTYDRANLRTYHNGILDDTVAFAAAVGNNVEPLTVFPPFPVSGQIQDSDVSLVALWGRVLTPQEAGLLWADPYRMWRKPRAGGYL